MAPEGADSRNEAINKAAIRNVELPSVGHLAAAAATARSWPEHAVGSEGCRPLRDLSLWEIDLSQAYRQLAAARDEWWQQSVVWADGVRVDKRCSFGSAHLVDFFQRVSSFILAVAMARIRWFDAAHPYAGDRAMWQQQRRRAGLSDSCSFAMWCTSTIIAGCQRAVGAQQRRPAAPPTLSWRTDRTGDV